MAAIEETFICTHENLYGAICVQSTAPLWPGPLHHRLNDNSPLSSGYISLRWASCSTEAIQLAWLVWSPHRMSSGCLLLEVISFGNGAFPTLISPPFFPFFFSFIRPRCLKQNVFVRNECYSSHLSCWVSVCCQSKRSRFTVEHNASLRFLL